MEQKPVEASQPVSQVSLDAKIEVRDSDLFIKYFIKNQGERDIYAFNRLVRLSPDGSGKVDPDLAYVTFSDDLTATISKSAQKIPSGLQVTQVESPYLTLVRAGETFQEEVKLPLPLTEHHPYLPMLRLTRPEGKNKEIMQTQTRMIRFELGYLVKNDERQMLAFEEGGETLYAMRGQFDAPRDQQFLRSQPVSLAVPALIPKDVVVRQSTGTKGRQ
ncbi:MAG: hypothetical protein WBP93_16905 [Pyrinomonadaceae bacterium]